MSPIVLGTAGPRKVVIDLDILLRARLLVQANSGGGKSWLLRRLAEQLFGKVPVIILDPEGEFATLREKYGYVLVGKGGETPADPRSAALVAHKLLELRASAVCDLFEMKASGRHEWVRLFLDALVEAPKRLWHPVVVIVDEAHVFCPEKGAGESEAADAMIGLATRGRKRGFAAVWATQRLGKLRKDAAAELLNVMIGHTFIDIDRERAADTLGIARADKARFFDEIRLLKEGHFFALGRAISLERVLVHVGAVETSHPEPGSSRQAAEPPPAPEKVRQLLPKLADLPKEAEAKAKTEAELRTEIRSLKGQLAARPTQVVETAKEKRVEVPILREPEITRLEAAALKIGTAGDRIRDVGQAVATAAAKLAAELVVWKMDLSRPPQPPFVRPTHLSGARHAPPPAVATARVPARPRGAGAGGDDLGAGERKMLEALALRYPTPLSKAQLGLLSGYTARGGTFRTYLPRLARLSLVDVAGDRVQLTEAGLQLVGARIASAPQTAEAVRAMWLVSLDQGPRRMLDVLIERYPKATSREELGTASGYTAAGGTFRTYFPKLRRLGLVEVRGDEIRASEELFG